jgi:hypothetical protein
VEAGAWQRGFGVSLAELERLNHAIAQALDGRVLTREELAVRVGELTGSAELGDKLRGSWGALLKPAAALGLVCFAPGQGQQVGFTRPDTWLGGWESHDPDQAVDEVTRRFLAASGPVTREDFARWWGIPSPAKGAKLLQRLGDEVARVEVEGAAAYALAADLPGLAEAEGSRTVRLLPAFDQYVVTATLQAERLMPGPYKARIYRPQGWLSPVLLVGGRMEGVWRQAVREQAVREQAVKGRAVKGRAFKGQEVKGRRVQVTVEPFTGSLPAWARKAAEAEAERLAAVAGGQLELTWAGA